VLEKNNKRSPKRLSDLCIESLCRALPFLEGDLPGGIPKEIVDDIVRSLLQHSALNAATLRAIRNCEIGSLILAGCRGVSDHWFEPFSPGAAQPSPQLSHCSDDGNIELMECINLVDDCTKTHEEVSDLNSCSTSSFLSATSTISSPVTTNTFENEAKDIQSLVTSKDKILDENIINNFSPITVLSSHLLLLDLRGSQGLTDRGLMQLTNLESLEVAKFDNCHSLVGSGFVALASSSRLHSISLANCRRLIDEAVVNISHLVSLENLNLDGCRCITDHSLAAMSSLYNLRKLDLSQCDLITDEGLENLEELDLLEELSLGWCRMISDKGLNIVTGQPGRSKLRVIRLARCKITDEGIMCLSRLMSLSALDLNGCSSIGSFTLGTVLEDLKMLEYLDVSFCPGIL
jgi:Leucine Rich repeat